MMRSCLSIAACVILLSTACLARGEPSKASAPLADLLRPHVEHGTLAGAVTLVARGDKILSLQAVGWADVAAKKPMQTDCLFGIASMTKPMTATAVMMLVDEGKLSVDDPVEKYLPEFHGQMYIAEQDADHTLLKRPRQTLLVRHLLTHTGGLLYQSPLEAPTLDGLPLRDAVRSHAMLPLQFEPGTRSLYSSAGVNTAARIVEVVGGMPYETFMARRIFTPLGMTDTTFVPSEAQIQRLAHLYKANAGRTGLEETTAARFTYPLSDPRRQPIPGSGLFSTAADVARFCRMILGGGVLEGKRYLSEAAVREMTGRRTPPEIKSDYGFCWERRADDAIGHGGSFHTHMTLDPATGLIVIFMSQQDGEWPNAEGRDMVPRLQAAARELAAAAPTIAAAAIAAPTLADVSYGPHPHQLLDVYLPPGDGPFPVAIWYGAIWVPKKNPGNLGFFIPRRCAVIAVETRTMADAQQDHVQPPVSYVLSDARRALKYVHLHAKEWKIDPNRIAVCGGSQSAVPAMFAGCTGATAEPPSADPVEREAVTVAAIALCRGPGSIDPKRLQEWNPGVEWGAPAWGCSFPESIKRYDELRPMISQWSPENFVTKDTPPIFIENEWGLTQPVNVTEANYRTHSPLWGIGLKKFVEERGGTCYQKYLGMESAKYKDIWDFLLQRLKPDEPAKP